MEITPVIKRNIFAIGVTTPNPITVATPSGFNSCQSNWILPENILANIDDPNKDPIYAANASAHTREAISM